MAAQEARAAMAVARAVVGRERGGRRTGRAPTMPSAAHGRSAIAPKPTSATCGG